MAEIISALAPSPADAAASPAPDSGSCLADQGGDCLDPALSHTLRIGAVFIILATSSLGIWLPYIGGKFSWVGRDTNVFLIVKAFGAGVILATGFIHMFPDASNQFANPCLGWPDYPYASLIAVVTVVVVLFLEHLVSMAYERRMARKLTRPHAVGAESNLSSADASENGIRSFVCMHVCPLCPVDDGHPIKSSSCRATWWALSCQCHDQEVCYLECPLSVDEDCANGACVPELLDEKQIAQEDARIRSFAIAQVLETGIALHSVLIGIALGVSNSPCTIRPLLAALTFHQFFEGVALGSCLIQAEFKSWAYALMALIFAITTPVGVAIGIGIQSTYNSNSLSNLIVSGVFDSVSTGILIYMALVDLIAVDFTTKRFRSSLALQVGSYLSLLGGVAVMAVIGIWA